MRIVNKNSVWVYFILLKLCSCHIWTASTVKLKEGCISFKKQCNSLFSVNRKIRQGFPEMDSVLVKNATIYTEIWNFTCKKLFTVVNVTMKTTNTSSRRNATSKRHLIKTIQKNRFFVVVVVFFSPPPDPSPVKTFSKIM